MQALWTLVMKVPLNASVVVEHTVPCGFPCAGGKELRVGSWLPTSGDRGVGAVTKRGLPFRCQVVDRGGGNVIFLSVEWRLEEEMTTRHFNVRRGTLSMRAPGPLRSARSMCGTSAGLNSGY